MKPVSPSNVFRILNIIYVFISFLFGGEREYIYIERERGMKNKCIDKNQEWGNGLRKGVLGTESVKYP